MRKRYTALVVCLVLAACATAPERSKITTNSGIPLSPGLQQYDIGHYVLRNDIDPDRKSITGIATISFTAAVPMDQLELDFDGQFRIDEISGPDGMLDYSRDEAKLYIELPQTLPAGATGLVNIAYRGRPHVAENPPWAGGFVWEKTPSGKPWIATAVQGEGCDLWWPCKDHPSGEPASMELLLTVPEGLTAVSNGVLVDVADAGAGKRTFHWKTGVPTNTYGIALNVGPYVLIEGSYESINGTVIPLKFWAIEEHEEQARRLFETEFADTIEFFERKVGPYPWGQEKLGVAETPHLGMEHQTINAYGNEYKRDDYGFDTLFHHELAHEWFGNVMTHETVSDMWLHEGFGAFMQPEYTREVMGDAAFHARMYRSYLAIKACNPIAPREEFSADELYFDDPDGRGPAGDIYTKGTWVLHSLRFVIGEEAFWRSVRRLVYDTPDPARLQSPIEARLRSTDDYLAIVSDEAGRDMDWFFDVYVRRGPLPELVATQQGDDVLLSWTNTGEVDFPMPVPVRVNGTMETVAFSANEARIENVRVADLQIDPFMQILRKTKVVPTCDERREEEEQKEKESA